MSNFRLDFFYFLAFFIIFHILIHTEYKIRQKETFTNDDQNFIFAKLSLLYLLIYRLDLRSGTISISSETFGKPWFYQLTALYFLWNRSYRYYDQYASDDRPMDLCCRHDRCTVIEWFGGHFIEHFYHERWWDYSKNKWNLDGYICLSHSVFWGLLGYIGVKFVNPLLFKFYHLIPPFIRHLIIFILLAVLIIDILATTIVVFGKNIDKRRWESADAYLTKISVKLSSLITSYVDRRVERAYPQRKLKLPTIPKTGVFAQGCGFYKVFLLFSIGSLLGDIIETIFCRLKMGVWMSRSSLVWGPFSIVWGFAFASVTLLLYRYKDRSDSFLFLLVLFLAAPMNISAAF